MQKQLIHLTSIRHYENQLLSMRMKQILIHITLN